MRPLPLFAVLGLSAVALAQVKAGKYIGTVAINSTTAEFWLIDPETRKATQMTGWNTAVQANCLTMLTPSLGWVGTVSDPSDIYRINVDATGTKITNPTKLNTSAITGGNIAQIGRIGAMLYFTTNVGSGTTAKNPLYKMPMGGGTVTQVLDLSAQTGWVAGRLANALAVSPSRVYVAAWTLGEIWEIDDTGTTPKATMLGTFPASRQSTAFYPVNMHYDASTGTQGSLIGIGLFGDVVVFDIAKKAATAHYHKPLNRASGASSNYLYANSGFPNKNTGDMGIGSRSGSFHVSVPVGGASAGQIAERDVIGIGTGTDIQASVNGLYYSADGTASTYTAYDQGCAGTGGAFPTSVGRGTARKGNAQFQFGVDSCPAGQNLAILLIGVTKLKVPLQPLFPPGCNLLTVPIFAFAVPTDNQTVPGWGSASIPLPLPNADLALATQWLIFHVANNKFDAASDGRLLTLK